MIYTSSNCTEHIISNGISVTHSTKLTLYGALWCVYIAKH